MTIFIQKSVGAFISGPVLKTDSMPLHISTEIYDKNSNLPLYLKTQDVHCLWKNIQDTWGSIGLTYDELCVTGGYKNVSYNLYDNVAGDTYIGSSTPTSNFDSVSYIIASHNSVGPVNSRGLLSFDISSIPESFIPHKASLKLYQVFAAGAGSGTIDYYPIQSGIGLDTTTATWNTYDGSNNWTTAGAMDDVYLSTPYISKSFSTADDDSQIEVSGFLDIFNYFRGGNSPVKLLLTTQESISTSVFWYQKNAAPTSDETPTFVIEGVEPGVSGVSLYSLPAYISGASSISFNDSLDLHIDTVESTGYVNSSANLYTAGPINFTGYFPLYMDGPELPSKTTTLYTKGTDDVKTASGVVEGSVNIYMSGSKIITYSGNMDMYVKVTSTGSLATENPLYIHGVGDSINSSLNLIVNGLTKTSTVNLFTKGYWSVFSPSSNPLSQGNIVPSRVAIKSNPYLESIAGGSRGDMSLKQGEYQGYIYPVGTYFFSRTSIDKAVPHTGSINLFLKNVGVATGVNAFIEGNMLSNDSMNIFMSGAVVSSGGLTMYMSPANDFESSTLNLSTLGYGI